MKTRLLTSISLTLIFVLGLSANLQAQKRHLIKERMKTETATFGAGCFWCTEALFERIDGVISVEPGYTGGNTTNPTYEEICSGTTGHAEVAQIVYNPEKVTYQDLLEVFWKIHDPTTLNRQGADVGTQYRSVIFYHDDLQKQLAQQYLDVLSESNIWNNPIVTQIEPLGTYYPAENYHKDYYERNPNNQYCTFVIAPKIKKFEEIFSDRLKK